MDKYFSRITSENAQKALEKPSHCEDGKNAGSQPDDVMPDNQSGSLCTRSEISHFEIIESDKEASYVHLMRLVRTKIQDLSEPLQQTILLHAQVSRVGALGTI